MNLKLIESFVELIELGAFANKEDIVKGLNSAIKVTKEQADLTDEEIIGCAQDVKYSELSIAVNDFYLLFARAILRKAQKK
jgi:copper chaperone CopZ